MSIQREKILDALKEVQDPNSGNNIVAMNMVKEVQIKGNDVNITLSLSKADEKHKQALNFSSIVAVNQLYPQANVHLHLMSTADTGNHTQNNTLPQVKNIIAVASGKGGVGKSTVSTNLALGLQMLGARVGLMDADLYGPSLPTMFGLQGQRPKIRDVNGKPKIVPLEAHGMPVISMGFIIEPEQAVVLRGPRLGAIIKQFFEDCLWPPLDYLIIDLPPGTGDIQLSLVQTVPVTGAIIVTTPQEVAVVDAVKAMNMFLLPNVNVPILGVVENMSWFTPAELPNNKYFIFGQGGGKKLVKESKSMLLGQIPLVQSVREAGDAGTPVIVSKQQPTFDAFMNICKNTLRQVALRNEMLSPTQQVKMES
jgi:ATP-binding protein involved in chromosome partitioning